MASSQLSAIIITKNEENRIVECLKNLRWADECLVIDNMSTDNTVRLAKEANARVHQKVTRSFAELRNFGSVNAAGVWLLYVDADETVTEKLKNEILRTIVKADSKSAYYISRENHYLGHKWPVHDRHLRLFRKDKLLEWTGNVHESPHISGPVGELRSPLIHHTHRTLSEMLDKTNEWSEIEADLRIGANHPPVVWWRFLRVMVTAFTDSYIKQKGYKAGTVGVIESIYQAFSIFVTYAKVWEKQINLKSQNSNLKS